jgi:hypothetical protein
MDLGERISPSSVSDLRKALFNVEPLREARTTLADFFSILLGLRLAFLMQPLVALAHWPAGLTLRENVLNLGFAAREIAIGWFP